jgi:methionyl-tRNA formyltransferase
VSRIAFFGENNFSVVVLKSLLGVGHDVALIICPFYETDAHKELENVALRNKIRFYREKNINSLEVVEKVQSAEPDFIISADFTKIIKNELLSIPKFASLNLHPSLLPNYRGLVPQHFPIINGETKTGVTVHFIDSGIDTGNIIIQKEIPINETTTVSDILTSWAKIYQTIMVEAVEKVLCGEKGVSQNKLNGSYYGRLKQSDCEIRFNDGIKNAYNLIRGVTYPYFGAFLKINNMFLRIWEAEIISTEAQECFGQVKQDGDDIILFFADGILRAIDFEEKKSENSDANVYLPSNTRLLLKRNITI